LEHKRLNKFNIKVKPHKQNRKVTVKTYQKYHKVAIKLVNKQNHKETVKHQQNIKQVKTHSHNSSKGRANTYHRTQRKSIFGGSRKSVFKVKTNK